MGPLLLPEPSLVVLVGAAGAGKTTFAARHFARDEVLSSDAIRGRISGDEADQTVTTAAFAVLHRALAARLAAGRTTVVDATSVTTFARRGLVERAAGARVPAIAIVLDLPPGIVLARNEARAGRTVPETAVHRQLRELRRSMRRGLAGEGFARVVVLATPAEVAGLRIERSGVARGVAAPDAP
jgi:predicted kinase